MRDDGVLYICQLENVAENGSMPVQKLKPISKHWFESRYIGFNRFYTAQGVNQKVDRLVRIERDRNIQIGMFAVLGNGEQFRIDFFTHGQDELKRTRLYDSKYYRSPKIVSLEYTEITLSKVEENYAVIADED